MVLQSVELPTWHCQPCDVLFPRSQTCGPGTRSMLLTSLMPEHSTKKSRPPPDGIGVLDRRTSLISKRYGVLKRRFLSLKDNADTTCTKKKLFSRRFSFPPSCSNREGSEEMIPPIKNVANDPFSSRSGNNQGSLFSIWRPDNCCESQNGLSDHEVKRLIKSLKYKFQDNSFTSQEISEIIQNIYKIVDRRLDVAVFKREITEEKAVLQLTAVESKLMNALYRELYNKILEENEELDRKLTDQIMSLFWITTQHLSAKINESDAEVSNLLDEAMLDIAAMNFKESPGGKLDCIMDCSRKIFSILKRHPKSSGCADDYLPILIYIILQVNPSRLHSNISYILQFSYAEKVIRGEEGYYFTHLCSVVTFIENMNALSLNLTEEQFTSYSSGNIPCEEQRMSCSRRLAGHICQVYNTAAEASALRQRQQKLMNQSQNLKKQMASLMDDIIKERIRVKESRRKIYKLMEIRRGRSVTSGTDVIGIISGNTPQDNAFQDGIVQRPEENTNDANTADVKDSFSCIESELSDVTSKSDTLLTNLNNPVISTSVKNKKVSVFIEKTSSIDEALEAESLILNYDLKDR